jgi:hypothetical protein
MTYPVFCLRFNDKRGLELPQFNTLRLGVAWSKKVQRGDRVLLMKGDEVIGSARVRCIFAGKRDEIIAAHAAGNHIELALAAEQGARYCTEQAFLRRCASMEDNYGLRAFSSSVNATAIYLRRLT